jgi:DNA-directed RNA polymerase specialized sigma24 family protein
MAALDAAQACGRPSRHAAVTATPSRAKEELSASAELPAGIVARAKVRPANLRSAHSPIAAVLQRFAQISTGASGALDPGLKHSAKTLQRLQGGSRCPVMSRKSGPRVPDDIRALEQLLESVRRDSTAEPGDSAKAILLRILEWRLARARNEPRPLVLDIAFIHPFVRPLHLLIIRLVGRHDTEDVTQDAFLSLLRFMLYKPVPKIAELVESENCLGRLFYRLTVCRAYDGRRRRKARRESVTANGEEQDLARDLAHAPQQPVDVDFVRVERAYAALPPLQRIAHVLHFYYGFTDADFEETLGWNKASARSLVYRANLALKAHLADWSDL